jgi:putative SOS response-associated peptidase YedK
MCGRMTLTQNELDEVVDGLEAALEGDLRVSYRARYNVAPTDTHPVLRLVDGQRRLGPGKWGWNRPTTPRSGSSSKRSGPLINARAETAASRAPFKEAYAHRRCVIPADGFFEWARTPQGRRPSWFHRSDNGVFLLAGLYEEDLQGAERRFLVLTTTPNALIAPVHDRMPAVLSREDAAAWLAAPAPTLLRPAADGLLVATTVSPRVNSVRNDDPRCLEPWSEATQPRQLHLF